MLKKILLSCFVIFGLTFLLSTNSYAVSDVSVTYTSVPSHYSDVFPTCTGDCLSDYKYLIIDNNNPYFGSFSPFYIRYDGSNTYNYSVSFSSTYSVYELPYYGAANNLLQWQRNLPSEIFEGDGFTLTLTNNFGTPVSGSIDISSNGTYDVSGFATAVVNIPTEEIIEDPISNDFQKVFFAIVEKIIPAFAILIVVWFGIDMLSSLIFGRGR